MIRIAALLLSLSLAGTASAETLRVLALSSEPFFYDDGGKPTGIEYEILSYFAKSHDLDIEVEYVDAFAEILERIANGDADVASGTITTTDERRRRMDFSAPYFPVQVVLVERSGETSRRPEDLSEHQVGAFAETTASEALERIDGVEVVQRSGIEGLLSAVASGEIRAAGGDSSAIMPVIDDYPALEITLTFGERQDFGFALPKGSPLRESLDDHIARLKQSGIYFRLVSEHMGPHATEVVRAARSP